MSIAQRAWGRARRDSIEDFGLKRLMAEIKGQKTRLHASLSAATRQIVLQPDKTTRHVELRRGMADLSYKSKFLPNL
jgi:hypothetical protein